MIRIQTKFINIVTILCLYATETQMEGSFKGNIRLSCVTQFKPYMQGQK